MITVTSYLLQMRIVCDPFHVARLEICLLKSDIRKQLQGIVSRSSQGNNTRSLLGFPHIFSVALFHAKIML